MYLEFRLLHPIPPLLFLCSLLLPPLFHLSGFLSLLRLMSIRPYGLCQIVHIARNSKQPDSCAERQYCFLSRGKKYAGSNYPPIINV